MVDLYSLLVKIIAWKHRHPGPELSCKYHCRSALSITKWSPMSVCLIILRPAGFLLQATARFTWGASDLPLATMHNCRLLDAHWSGVSLCLLKVSVVLPGKSRHWGIKYIVVVVLVSGCCMGQGNWRETYVLGVSNQLVACMYLCQAACRHLGYLILLPAHAEPPGACLLELEWRLFNLWQVLDQLMSAGIQFQCDAHAGCAHLEACRGCHHGSWAAKSHCACHRHPSSIRLQVGRLIVMPWLALLCNVHSVLRFGHVSLLFFSWLIYLTRAAPHDSLLTCEVWLITYWNVPYDIITDVTMTHAYSCLLTSYVIMTHTD